jgi:hypothetical protein
VLPRATVHQQRTAALTPDWLSEVRPTGGRAHCTLLSDAQKGPGNSRGEGSGQGRHAHPAMHCRPAQTPASARGHRPTASPGAGLQQRAGWREAGELVLIGKESSDELGCALNQLVARLLARHRHISHPPKRAPQLHRACCRQQQPLGLGAWLVRGPPGWTFSRPARPAHPTELARTGEP